MNESFTEPCKKNPQAIAEALAFHKTKLRAANVGKEVYIKIHF